MLTVSSCLTSPNRKPSCANALKTKLSVIKRHSLSLWYGILAQKQFVSFYHKSRHFLPCHYTTTFCLFKKRISRSRYRRTFLVRNEAKPARSKCPKGQADGQSFDKAWKQEVKRPRPGIGKGGLLSFLFMWGTFESQTHKTRIRDVILIIIYIEKYKNKGVIVSL